MYEFVLRFDEIGAMWACMRGRESSYVSSKRSLWIAELDSCYNILFNIHK